MLDQDQNQNDGLVRNRMPERCDIDETFALDLDAVARVMYVPDTTDGRRQGRSWELVPDGLRYGLYLWVKEGQVPGQFLSAVLANNLSGAIAHGDADNARILSQYVRFLYNWCPSSCWGSKEKMQGWAALGGIDGAAAGAAQLASVLDANNSEGAL
jgi:hypothetical protein